MRLVYLDESGISSKREEPWLAVAGIIVHGDHQIAKVEAELEETLKRHIPEEDRDGFVLHAADIYGGYGKYFDKRKTDKWPAERRWPILADLAQIPAKTNIWVTSSFIERAKFPQTYELPEGANHSVEAHVVAFCSCGLEVEHWFRQNARREHCMLIAEDNRDARKHMKEALRGLQDKKQTPGTDPLFEKYFPFRHIKEDVAFQEKRSSHPLVLADFLAFITKRHAMGDQNVWQFYQPWFKRLISVPDYRERKA